MTCLASSLPNHSILVKAVSPVAVSFKPASSSKRSHRNCVITGTILMSLEEQEASVKRVPCCRVNDLGPSAPRTAARYPIAISKASLVSVSSNQRAHYSRTLHTLCSNGIIIVGQIFANRLHELQKLDFFAFDACAIGLSQQAYEQIGYENIREAVSAAILLASTGSLSTLTMKSRDSMM